jgi:hypothetical protein
MSDEFISENDANLEKLRKQQLKYHEERCAQWRAAYDIRRELLRKAREALASLPHREVTAKIAEIVEHMKACKEYKDNYLTADIICKVYEPSDPGQNREGIRLLYHSDRTEKPLLLYHVARSLEARDAAYIALTYISLERHFKIADETQERLKIQETSLACVQILKEYSYLFFDPRAAQSK